MVTSISDIDHFFAAVQPTFLTVEQAICYILDRLLCGESFGTKLVRELDDILPGHRLSDTICNAATKFLLANKTIVSRPGACPGRGRPRTMYEIVPARRIEAQRLADYWRDLVRDRQNLIKKNKYAQN